MKTQRRVNERMLEDADIFRMQRLYARGLSTRRIAEEMNVGPTLVWKVLSGEGYDGKGKVEMRNRQGRVMA